MYTKAPHKQAHTSPELIRGWYGGKFYFISRFKVIKCVRWNDLNFFKWNMCVNKFQSSNILSDSVDFKLSCIYEVLGTLMFMKHLFPFVFIGKKLMV